MRRTRCLLSFVLCTCGIVVVAGCNVSPGSTASLVSSPPVTTPPASPPATPPVTRITQPSVYVVMYGSVGVFPLTASGSSAPYLEIPGSNVSVDGVGNIYVLDHNGPSVNTVTGISVYSPDSPTGKPVRSLPVGPGTKISAAKAMVASAGGEIFVSDGQGLAVFSPTATGDADPVRYILGNTQSGGGASTAIIPGFIAVDNADTLYVQNTVDSSIVVFGPTDTGTVVPSRTIAGPLTQLPGTGPGYNWMATDAPGNLYVLCYCRPTGLNPFGVLEFGPTADGNVAPMRYVTTPGMDGDYDGVGVAVDSDGTIYVNAAIVNTDTKTVFEFPSTASGSVTPSSTFSSPGWDGSYGGIAVH